MLSSWARCAEQHRQAVASPSITSSAQGRHRYAPSFDMNTAVITGTATRKIPPSARNESLSFHGQRYRLSSHGRMPKAARRYADAQAHVNAAKLFPEAMGAPVRYYFRFWQAAAMTIAPGALGACPAGMPLLRTRWADDGMRMRTPLATIKPPP